MARLLVAGEWYDPVSADSLYEADFEGLLLQHAETIYPQFHAVRFKKRVSSEFGNGEPDLALIDKRYRVWWLVEVELGSHPLGSHVAQQVEIFANAAYGPEEAEYLAERNAHLDRSALTEMMLGAQPRVLVLVNQAKPEWTASLARYNALVGVAEIFRSPRNHTILRINGEHPEPLGEHVTECHLDPLLPSFVVVEAPAGLGVPSGGSVEIWHDGSLTEWKRRDSATSVWLIPTRRFPLPPTLRSFALLRADDGRLTIHVRRRPVRAR